MDTDGSLITRIHMHAAVSESLLPFLLEPLIKKKKIYFILFFSLLFVYSGNKYFLYIFLCIFFFLFFFLNLCAKKRMTLDGFSKVWQ